MKRNIVIIVVGAILLSTASALGQMAASPVATPGTGQWTVSAMGGYFYQGIGSEDAQSYRLLIKSAWGVAPWLDLYAMGGAADLSIDPGDPALSTLDDDFRLAYGLGLNTALDLPVGNGLQFWGGAHAIRYEPRGDFRETLLIGSDVYTQKSAMKYDWREIKAFAGVALPVGPARFYLGGAAWWLLRKETQTVTRIGDGSVANLGTVEGEYRSGMWSGGVLGVELRLPDHFALAVEALFFNESNVQVFISLMQTGATGWKPLE